MPQGQDDDQSQGQGGKQQYVVKATFTDDKGRTWNAGTAFTGDEAAVRKALAAGQIAQGRPENKPAQLATYPAPAHAVCRVGRADDPASEHPHPKIVRLSAKGRHPWLSQSEACLP